MPYPVPTHSTVVTVNGKQFAIPAFPFTAALESSEAPYYEMQPDGSWALISPEQYYAEIGLQAYSAPAPPLTPAPTPAPLPSPTPILGDIASIPTHSRIVLVRGKTFAAPAFPFNSQLQIYDLGYYELQSNGLWSLITPEYFYSEIGVPTPAPVQVPTPAPVQAPTPTPAPQYLSISVGSTTTGPAGTSASVSNSGTSTAAVLDFTVPRGLAATISVGSVSTGSAGSSTLVSNTGTPGAAVLSFTVPRGDSGLQPWTTPPVPWAASTVYSSIVPATSVTYGGESYVCSVSHTSGVSFDPTSFTLIAARGASVAGGSVVGVSGTSPVVSSGGISPDISLLPSSGLAPGSMSAADFTKLSGVAVGATSNGPGTITGTSSGTNTGDNATNTQYSSLVSNATHTGDATGSTVLTLATVNLNVGSFGSSSAVPVVTVNAKGLVTAVSTTTVTPASIGAQPAGAYATGTGSATGTNTGDQTITLTGGVTGSGTGSFAATVVTNANLTGAVTSVGNAASLGSFTSAQLATALTDETGTGAAVFASSPTFTGVVTLPQSSVAPGILGSATPAVTAAGTTQGTATLLSSDTNVVTVATANQGVTVPSAIPGKRLVVNNSTAVTILVYPAVGNFFDSLAVNVGISLSAGGLLEMFGYSSTQWSTTYQVLTQGSLVVGNISGSAATVTTNANLTGVVTSSGNATSLGSFTSAQLSGALTDETGTGAAVFSTSPSLVTPALGTPSALVATNATGTAAGLTSGNVTTNANLTGAVTSVGNTASLGSFTSAQLSTALTDETGTGSAVFGTSPTLVTPALGTPSSLVATNATGTAPGLTAGTVVTNANLTGAVTSVGNATSLGSFTSAQLAGALTDETGTGAAVFSTSPSLVTPVLNGSVPQFTLAADPTTSLQPATKQYADALVVGLIDDRGSYNASVNTFPTTGGSGTAGAVLKGDLWYVSAAGTLGGVAVNIGDSFRALVDTPAQVPGNWSVLEANIGYVPYNATNPAGYTSNVGTVTSVAALNLGTTGTDVSSTVSSSSVSPVITLNLPTASATNRGALSSADWTTFNSKQPAGTYATGTGTASGTNTGDQTITLTGGVTGSGTGSFAATVVTNANLTGAVTSVGNASSLGSFTSAQLATALTDETGTGAAVFAGSPTFTGVVTLPQSSVAPGILGSASSAIPAAGTTQATATALTSDVNIVTTATANQGVTVPGATSGKYAVIVNRTAVTIVVYPSTGHAFDGLAANTGISLLAGGFLEIFGYSSTQWSTTYQAVTQGQYVVGNISGSAGTVTTNANLTGAVTSVGNASSLGSFTSAQLSTALTDETGTGSAVFSTSPTLGTPVLNGLPTGTGVSSTNVISTLVSRDASGNFSAGIITAALAGTASGNLVSGGPLGTPSSGTATNITGTAPSLTAGTVTTNANLTGAVTSVGNASSLGSFTSAQLSGALTDKTGTGSAVFSTSPTLVTPALGTPSSLVATNATGTASGLTAGNVTTNANSTGAVTSTGNATALGSFSSAQLSGALADKTGTGVAVFATSPTFAGVVTLPQSSVAPGLLGSAASLTAAGTTQATATAITADINTVATATANQGVVLPSAVSGKKLSVANLTAVTTIVYPAVGQFLDGSAVNVGISLLAGGLLEFFGYSSTQWSTTYQSILQGQYVVGNISGSAGTVVTNANLTGVVTSVGNATSLGSFTSAQLSSALTDETGTGSAVFATSPVLVSPSLGTPTSGVATNLTGIASGLTAGTVTTNASLTGAITSVGNATSLGSFTSAQLSAALTDETGTGSAVFGTSPTLVTPALGTPSALVATNLTGTASGLTAGTVVTNANLTGEVTSVGNSATVLNAAVIAKVLTGYVKGSGTVAATDSIIAALQKLDGNVAAAAAGSVLSVSGTAPIVSSGGASPAISITPASGTAAGSMSSADFTKLSGAEVLSNKDASGGYTGLTLFKINFKNALNTFTSFFTNANTAARTYTLQDRDGTIADGTDLALKANLSSPTFTGVVTLPQSSIAPGILGSATTAVTAAGTTQGTATALTSDVSVVTTATVNQGVSVSSVISGKRLVVVNSSPVTIIVYPATGHSFDSLAVNVGIYILAGGFIEMFGYSSTQWSTTYQILTRGSLVVGNIPGSAATVTTNANLTGAVTSVGNVASLGSFTSAQLATALTDETGTGSAVFGTSPTLVTPALGTPSSATLTNATGLPPAGVVGTAAILGANTFTGQQTSSAGDLNLKTNTALADVAATLTATQLVQGLFTITPTVARSLTTDTAANIIAALGGYVVGSNFQFTIVNTAAFDVTLVAGVGVTLRGTALINATSGTWRVRIDSATALTIYTSAVGSASSGGGASSLYTSTLFTASASQTVFTVSYTVGFVQVYLNGIKLQLGTDFTATSGTSVVLSTGASLNDALEVVAFTTFSVANTYTQSYIDTNIYTKTQIDTNLYTRAYIDASIQLKLVSGTNLLTINGSSLLGSGDLSIPNVSDYVLQSLGAI